MNDNLKISYYYEYDSKQDTYIIYKVLKSDKGEFKHVFGYVFSQEERAKELVDALNKTNE